MSKKDYVLIASVIRDSSTLEEFVDKLLPELKLDNDNFNSEKFLEYIKN